jgi:poly(3-hydroxybutyrate) depolymerase
MRFFKTLMVLFAMFGGQLQAAPPPAFVALCAGVVPAGGGTITAEEVMVQGVARYYCLFKPSSYPLANTKHRVLYAFHGGNQNAQRLMQASKGIIAEAEARNYVVVFAQGADKDTCGIGYTANANWTDTDCTAITNVEFTRRLMNKVAANNQVESNNVQLAGFSGGSKHIYRMVAQWSATDKKIRSLATMAGSIGKLSFGRHRDGVTYVDIMHGKQVNAMLLQGGADNRMPINGGISDREQEISVGFNFKVDMFRALNAARAASGAINTGASNELPVVSGLAMVLAGTPAGSISHEYIDAKTVISIEDPSLGHTWPSWYSQVAFDFFDRF